MTQGMMTLQRHLQMMALHCPVTVSWSIEQHLIDVLTSLMMVAANIYRKFTN